MANAEPTQEQDPLAVLAQDEQADKQGAAEAAQADLGRHVQAPQSPPAEEPADAVAAAQQQQAEWEADQRFGGDPSKIYTSYRELERKLGSRDEGTQAELAELRAFREQVQPFIQQQQSQHQQAQPQTLPDGTPIYEMAQLQQLVDNGDLSEFQASAVWAEQQAKIYAIAAAEQIHQQYAPLVAAQTDRGARDTLDALNAELGDEVVSRHAPLIGQLIEADRAHFADPKHGQRRLREAIIAAEWDASNGTSRTAPQPRQNDGRFAPRPADTYVEGGSSAAPPSGPVTPTDPQEEALVQSLTWQRPTDENGIPLPRW